MEEKLTQTKKRQAASVTHFLIILTVVVKKDTLKLNNFNISSLLLKFDFPTFTLASDYGV